MGAIVRSILAVVLGVILAAIVVGLVEFIGQRFYPLPEGVDPADPEALKAVMAKAPFGMFLFVLVAWFIGTFAGGWFAAWFSGRSRTLHALVVGALLMAAGIWNMLMITSPLWFWIVGVALFLPAAYMGARLAPRRA
jgi:hypothetical protein